MRLLAEVSGPAQPSSGGRVVPSTPTAPPAAVGGVPPAPGPESPTVPVHPARTARLARTGAKADLCESLTRMVNSRRDIWSVGPPLRHAAWTHASSYEE